MNDESWDIRIKPGAGKRSSVYIITGKFITIISSVVLIFAISSVILRLINTGFQDLDTGLGTICISALMLIIGVSLSASGTKQSRLRNEFENSQRIANGEVVDRGIEAKVFAGDYGDITGAARLNWVVVRFQAVTSAGLQSVTLRACVSMKVYRKLIPGEAIKIHYSSTNPQMALLEGE